eukprot:7690846-Prorocentrum_lima.AAC.1
MRERREGKAESRRTSWSGRWGSARGDQAGMRSRRAKRRGTCRAWRASRERVGQDSAPCKSRETTS